MKMKRRKSSKQRLQQLLPLLAVLSTTILLTTLQNVPCVEATITFVGGKYYKTVEESRFGTQLSYGVEYVARLQFVGDYVKKANSLNHFRFGHHHRHNSQHHNNNHHPQKYNNDNDNDNDPNHDLDQYLCDESSAANGLIVPSDDLPVALLASAGRCTIQTKAIIASNLSPKGTVHHLIIYGYDDNNYNGNHDHNDDDDDDDDYNSNKSSSTLKSSSKDNYFFKNYDDTTTSKPRLLSWFNDDGEQVTVSILYISNQDGLEMIDKLKQQPQESYDFGGLRILVDGYDGWIPSYDDEVTPLDIVSIISLLLLCCMALSCLSTTSNLTAPPSAGILVVDGTHDGDENLLPGRYRHGLRLLNREEVLSLPEVAFGLERALGVDDVVCCDGCVSGGNDNADADGDISLTPLLDENNDNDKDSSLMMNEAAAAASNPSSEPIEQPFHDIACTICLEDYEEGEMLRVLPCNHAFHSECIVPWLSHRAPTCPLCKALLEVVRDGDDEHRRQVEEEEGEEGAIDGEEDVEVSGEEMLGAILSNDEEEMVDEDDQEPLSQTSSSWRSLYHSFMGTSRETTVQEQTEQQEVQGQVQLQLQESQTSNEAGEDIEMPTTSTSESESDQQNTRSGAMGSLTTSWRRLFPTSRSGTGTGTGTGLRNENLESSTSVNGSQNGLADLREPLLNNDSNSGSGIEESEIV